MGFLYSQLFVTPALPTTSYAKRTVIVTGSNTGLGLEAARHIARLNADKVIIAVRNVEAGKRAAESIEETTGRAGVCEVWQLDLASFDSVKAFAARAASLERLDVALLNAGVATEVFTLAEGHERTVMVNVLGTFLLALLLLPKLQSTATAFPDAAAPPHLTIVSSEVHGWAKFPERHSPSILAALDNPATKTMNERYPTSKLLEVLVIREIAPRLTASAPGVVLNMLNPGLCHSELGRDSGIGLYLMKAVLARTTEVGSRTLVAGTVAGRASHGKYMTDGQVADEEVVAWVKGAEGKEIGRRLWEEVRGVLEEAAPGATRVVGEA
ncbi:uncharacterized protein K452DRAFT_291634 [Aplosporella prunicola CBS 121167]|uniref:Ketoreductase (KR) domain-containing protein n=1 Tax=Aplosporella prunicola CBS 121167 TaxID=1176127 RepID=A0A6A6B297_9PEZI|nr:uncharacterized protein K452DRAFT_291634 [Aplosporella prunicola CBS 121167]KAF2137385.1 hypothetical protein K452DRAFT_291634 [Aplosporella prunicola CBS 121167]